MTNGTVLQEKQLVLPSDQDSSGRTLGQEEIALLKEVIDSGTLTSTKGAQVKTLERQFAQLLGCKHAYACSSGTAAIHTAIAALDPEPGEEVVVSPITDMGALTPILYQGAIPVFADVDPVSLNVTAETLSSCISERTRAIVVTHLFGNPCDMDGILKLGEKHGIPVVEDCAQAFLAQDRGRYAGTMGAIGCFSTQQGKHMTTGEGGLVTCQDDNLARRMFLFINKGFGYGDAQPDHYFIALNYRMSELQGAVAVAQAAKLHTTVRARIDAASQLSEQIRDLPGLILPTPPPGGVHVYWKYCLSVDPDRIQGGSVALGKLLKAKGINSSPRYIQKPAFECEIFQKQRTFGRSRFPFTLARPEALDYNRSRFPMTYQGLDRILVLPWNERYESSHVDYIGDCLREAVEELCHT